MRVPSQFNLRALGLLTIACAGVLAAITQSGPVGALLAGLLCLTAGTLMGRPGALVGAASGGSYAVLGLMAAAVGFPQLVWPGEGFFFVYWWLATGILLGAAFGSVLTRRADDSPAPTTPLSWFASAHLHVIAGTALSFTVVGLSGHLPGGGRYSVEAGELSAPLLACWAPPVGDGEVPLEACETDVADGEGVFLVGPEFFEDSPSPPPRPALEIPHDIHAVVSAWRPKVYCPAATIAGQVSQLRDPARRAAALMWLLQCDDSIVPALHELRRQSSSELQQDIDVVLGSFRGDTGSGGLSLALLADKTVLESGDTVKLTTVIRNTLGEPINLCVGWGSEMSDNSFMSGWALAALDVPAGEKPLHPRCAVGRCGNGTGPVCTSLPPGETLAFHMAVVFDAAPRTLRQGVTIPANSYHLPDTYSYLKVSGTTHRLAVTRQVDAAAYETGNRRFEDPTSSRVMIMSGRPLIGRLDPAARNWVGEAISNEVVLRVK